LVEVYGGLKLVKTIRYLGELGAEQGLLCREHFQISSVSMRHQQLGATHGIFKRFDLVCTQVDLSLCGLGLGKCVVHLFSGVEHGLLESELGLLLLRFRYFQLGDIRSFVK